MPPFQPNDLSEVVMAVAFAIEDPCGVEAIELARALIELGRATPGNRRLGLAALCRAKARSFEPISASTTKESN